MPLRLTNSLTDEEEVFEPRDPENVTLYYCGLTVSDDAHLGHARSWVHTDVLHRWLEFLGYSVKHVENFTDVNEKIAARIGDCGTDEAAVARHFIGRILEDMRSLRLKRVSVYPRVSEHLPEIIALIENLLDRGHAYEVNGSVYFDVTTFEEYGRLSNLSVDEMEAQGTAPTEEKRNPQDFALWKADGPDPTDLEEHRTPEAEPSEIAVEKALTFDSPWGSGRPGWHIECSAMATSHLHDTFDVHVAGRDIRFPHNENEIAQAVAGTDGEYARYWLHTGLLQTEGEKMSSSLQNYFRVRDAADRWGADVIRTFFLSTVYDADQTFSESAMAEAESRWNRLKEAYDRAVEAADSVDARTKVEDDAFRRTIDDTRSSFRTAMNDDLNTREAMSVLLELASAINRHLDERSEFDYQALQNSLEMLERLGGSVFGLALAPTVRSEVQLHDENRRTADLVELVLELREDARDSGDFEAADALRSELEAIGILVEDTAEGPTYRFENPTTPLVDDTPR